MYTQEETNNLNVISVLMKLIQNMSQDMYFYFMFRANDNSGDLETKYYRTISIRGNEIVLLQPVELSAGAQISEVSNLEGIHINCLTLSWAPYLTLSDCDGGGKNCRSVGYFADLMNIAGEHLNFTWSCDKEPNNDWGIMQISGPSN